MSHVLLTGAQCRHRPLVVCHARIGAGNSFWEATVPGMCVGFGEGIGFCRLCMAVARSAQSNEISRKIYDLYARVRLRVLPSGTPVHAT